MSCALIRCKRKSTEYGYKMANVKRIGQSMVYAVALITLAYTTTDAAVILTRMSGDDLAWAGVVPAGKPTRYAWQADVYLTDDLTGGIVWLRSDYRDKAWVVNASPMGTPDRHYLFGDGVELQLLGAKPIEGALTWWPDEYNPENYVTSLQSHGRLWDVVPGAIVPEPGQILMIGFAIALLLCLLSVKP